MTGLLVPYAGTFANVGGRVLVAWNGSAQAARAVNDALPFLQSAERVVVTVNPARGDRAETPILLATWRGTASRPKSASSPIATAMSATSCCRGRAMRRPT